MEEDKEEELEKNKLLKEKLDLEDQIVGMAQEIERLNQIHDEDKEHASKLNELFHKGVIDKDKTLSSSSFYLQNIFLRLCLVDWHLCATSLRLLLYL
jgi:hypothetical protein